MRELMCVQVLRKVLVHTKLQKWWQWSFHATHKGNSQKAMMLTTGFAFVKIAYLVSLSVELPSSWFGCGISKSIPFLKQLVTFCWLENEIPWYGTQGSFQWVLGYAVRFLWLQATENNENWLNKWGMCCLLYLKSWGADCFRHNKIQAYKRLALSLW